MAEHNALAAQRRKARHYGLQALYQWTLSGASVTDIEAEFRVDNDFRHTDAEYFGAVLRGVTAGRRVAGDAIRSCAGPRAG